MVSFEAAAFTSDGNWFVYRASDAAGKLSMFRVLTTGGQPERLGDAPPANGRCWIWISPDGQKIIAQTLHAEELWALENFEPKQQAAK